MYMYITNYNYNYILSVYSIICRPMQEAMSSFPHSINEVTLFISSTYLQLSNYIDDQEGIPEAHVPALSVLYYKEPLHLFNQDSQ